MFRQGLLNHNPVHIPQTRQAIDLPPHVFKGCSTGHDDMRDIHTSLGREEGREGGREEGVGECDSRAKRSISPRTSSKEAMPGMTVCVTSIPA